MTRLQKIAAVAGIGLLIFGVVLSQLQGVGSGGKRQVGPDPSSDRTNGLLALTLLLDENEHDVKRVSDTPSDGLDPDRTALLVDPGTLRPGDADALHDLADEGGRVVLAGDPGDDALSRILGTDAEISSGGSAATATPLVVAPETAGVASLDLGDAASISPGGALPIAGSGETAVAVTAAVGEGRVVVVSDSGMFLNDRIGSADNALFALNLAGPPGRGVSLVEAVEGPPGSGLSALPSSWGWAAAGLLAAALALAFARGRRLGPPELEARQLAPPRRRYMDAMAGSLMRTGDAESAADPLREAVRDRLARRGGLSRDPTEEQIRAVAESAGLEPAEIAALTEGGSLDSSEDAMLACAGALAKLNSRNQ